MNEEYDYMEGFEDLEYVDPVVPDYYSYLFIDIRKLSDEQLEFMKNTLQISYFEGDLYLNYSPSNKRWFTYDIPEDNDKEI